MRTLRGLPAALGASGVLMAAAPAVLIAVAALVGLRGWTGHSHAHADRPAVLALRGSEPAVVAAREATPTAAPVALSRGARRAAGTVTSPRRRSSTRTSRDATRRTQHRPASRGDAPAAAAPGAPATPNAPAPASTTAPAASRPAPAVTTPGVSVPALPAVPVTPPSVPPVTVPVPPLPGSGNVVSDVTDTLATTVAGTAGAVGNTVEQAAGALGLPRTGSALNDTLTGVGQVASGLLHTTSSR